MKSQPTVMFMILKESIILTVISKDLKNLFLRVLTLQDTFIGRLWTTLNGHTAIPNVLDLTYVDYKTQKRILKDSAYRYNEIIRTNGADL